LRPLQAGDDHPQAFDLGTVRGDLLMLLDNHGAQRGRIQRAQIRQRRNRHA
jgi:hypothetical protein